MHNIYSAKLRFVTCILMAVGVITVSSGCGNGSQNAAKSSAVSAGRGTVTISVQWPAPSRNVSRLIPGQANCIKVVFGTKGVFPPVLIQRPTVSADPALTITTPVTSVKVDNVPVGLQTVTATATPGADGSGVAQAGASTSVTVLSNQTVPLNLALKTTITHIKVSAKGKFASARSTKRDAPPPISLLAGGTEALTATALDVNNQVVMTDPKKWQWQSASSGVLAITADQADATIKGGTVGSTTMTVTESESNVNTQVTVSVTGGQGWTQRLADAQNSSCTPGPASGGALAGRFALPSVAPDGPIIEGPSGTLAFLAADMFIPDTGLYVYSTGGVNESFAHIGGSVGEAYAYGLDGTVYSTGRNSSNVLVSSLGSGSTVNWEITASSSGNNPPAPTVTSDGTVYAILSGTLYAINGSNGSKLWTAALGGDLNSATKPAVGLDGTVYSGTSLGIGAFDPITGKKLWEMPMQISYVGVAPSGAVIAATGTGHPSTVVGLDPATGATLWTVADAGAPLVISRTGSIYASTVKRTIAAFNSATGTALWKSGMTANIAGGAVDGTLYVNRNLPFGLGSIGEIDALNGTSGATIWSYSLPANNSSFLFMSLAGKDGTIYATGVSDADPHQIFLLR